MSLVEMAKDLVVAQIAVGRVLPEQTGITLQDTFDTLQRLQRDETREPASSVLPEATEAVDWKRSITKHAVMCLECGGSFRQLSLRHLRVHDLNPRTYRRKYGIPPTQPLSSREATARRRELAQQIRPWERAASKRQATSQPRAKAASKAPAKRKQAATR